MESMGGLPVRMRYHAAMTSRGLRFRDRVVDAVIVTMPLLVGTTMVELVKVQGVELAARLP
jgi:hypothetical protein